MRVGLVYHAMRVDAGIPKMHVQLARYLAAQGHDVHVYGNLADSDPTLVPEARFHDVGRPQRAGRLGEPWSVARFRRGADALLRADPLDVIHGRGMSCSVQDIVHVTGLYDQERAGELAARETAGLVRGAKDLLAPITYPLGGLRRRYERAIARTPALRFHAETSAVERALVSSYGIDAGRITVVVPGVDVAAFSPAGSRADIGLEGPVIAFCGHDYHRKGLDHLLRALPRMTTRAGLAVIGGGRHLAGEWSDRAAEPFVRLAAELGVRERVRFLGAQPDVAPLFRAADVLAHPARFDVWGLAVGEAMATGLPVVVSSTTGASELIDGDNGTVLRRGDDPDELAGALDALLDPRMRESAALHARSTAERVSVERQGALVEADLERVVAARLARG